MSLEHLVVAESQNILKTKQEEDPHWWRYVKGALEQLKAHPMAKVLII